MKTADFGDLRVGMTTSLDWVWDDTKTGSNRDANIYNPRPQDGLLPLGSIGFSSHHDVKPRSGTWGVLLVGNVPGKDVCKHPTDFTLTWKDTGGGGKFDMSMWRPIAPDGYVAMGEYCVNNYNKPSVNDVWCIRKDYVADGRFESPSWWDDRGSGADLNVSCWEVTPMNISLNGGDYIPIRTDTFYGKDGTHTTLPPSSLAKTLRLFVGRQYEVFNPPIPSFTIDTLPKSGQAFATTEQASVTLPYTAFFHPTDSRSRDLIADPFVKLSRSCCWHVGGVWRNGGEGSFERTVAIECGISKEKSQSLSQTTGVTITSEAGVSAGPFSSSLSMSLNYQMTSESSSSQTEFTNRTVTEKFTVPAKSATVLFTRRMFYKTVRSDGSEVVAEVAIDAADEVHFGSCKI